MKRWAVWVAGVLAIVGVLALISWWGRSQRYATFLDQSDRDRRFLDQVEQRRIKQGRGPFHEPFVLNGPM